MARGVPRLPAVVMFSSNSTSRVPNTFAVYIVARSSRFLLFGHPLRVLSGRSVDVFDQSFSRELRFSVKLPSNTRSSERVTLTVVIEVLMLFIYEWEHMPPVLLWLLSCPSLDDWLIGPGW